MFPIIISGFRKYVFFQTCFQGNAPAIMPSVVLKSDDLQWKDYVTKPALRFILRALAGLSVKHSPTQLAVSEHCIQILHQIEQVSSDEHVGSLAEAVLEAIRGHPEVEDKVFLMEICQIKSYTYVNQNSFYSS
jgi:hypothetical protein